jgi:hypothetical protein
MTDYIYLLQRSDFVKNNQSIYKIGKTRQENLTRFHQYPLGSRLIIQKTCINCDNIEKELILQFKNKYIHRSDIGNEYFEGDYMEMQKDIENKINNITENNIVITQNIHHITDEKFLRTLYWFIDKIFKVESNRCIKKTNIKSNHSKIHVGNNEWEIVDDVIVYNKIVNDILLNFLSCLDKCQQDVLSIPMCQEKKETLQQKISEFILNHNQNNPQSRRDFKKIIHYVKIVVYNYTKNHN